MNPLYREYAETLKVAKLILKRFSYNIDLVTKDADNLLPPFYIDMSLLFELYVYSQLKLAYKSDIHHHLRSFGNEIDFVKYREQLIIDATYITKWKDSVLHDNIRQLSGYARNHSLREKIMKNQNNDTTILNCVIVYPNENGCQKFDPDNSFISNSHSPNSYEPIDSYLKFHRIAIKLPNKD